MTARALLTAGLLLIVSACEREQRQFEAPPVAQQPPTAPMSSHPKADRSIYDGNAFAISEGKRLFRWYNCNGCHANGGGSYGPALMDEQWIYGAEPETLFVTITQGRPNGMPSFGGRIPESQVWQLVAYVRSMSALVDKAAAPGRSDSLTPGEPEARRERGNPRSDSPALPGR